MTTDYPYGDDKTGYIANFGIFKQNWSMLRTSASEFKGDSVTDVDDGAVLNSDLRKGITARHEADHSTVLTPDALFNAMGSTG